MGKEPQFQRNVKCACAMKPSPRACKACASSGGASTRPVHQVCMVPPACLYPQSQPLTCGPLILARSGIRRILCKSEVVQLAVIRPRCYNLRIIFYLGAMVMAKSLKVRKIGNSYGLILSKEMLDELGVREGDSLFPVRMPDGVYLTPYDPDFEAVMESTRDYMRRHRNALRELARR